MEVVDSGHPLFGQRFQLLSVTRGTANVSQVFVRFRDGITLRVPLRATSLSTWAEDAPRAKLSVIAVQELLALVKEYEQCPRHPEKSGMGSRRHSGKNSSKN